MVKAKSTKNQPAVPQRDNAKAGAADGRMTNESVEPMVIALAEQLGTFLGRVQAKADGWLENETLRAQVSQIRDRAAELLDHVNRASVTARRSVAKMMPAVKSSAAPAEEAATAPTTRASRGAVDAPGKRHRKPPPQESINQRMGEPRGKKLGQKQFKVGKSRGRG